MGKLRPREGEGKIFTTGSGWAQAALTARTLPSLLARAQVLTGTGFLCYAPHPCSYRALISRPTSSTPPHPSPSWLGPRHPEAAYPQCREHPSAIANTLWRGEEEA